LYRSGILVLVHDALAAGARIPKWAALAFAAHQCAPEGRRLDDSVAVLLPILQGDVAGNWLDFETVGAFWAAEDCRFPGESNASLAGLAAEVIGEIVVVAWVEVWCAR
jgi:hypothetical protein